MPIDSGSAGAIAAAIVVPIAVRALARLFPAREAPQVALSLEELRARYRGWELGFTVGGLALAVGAGVLLWLALRGLSAAHAALLPRGDLLWVTTREYWVLPAIGLALAVTIPLTTWAERRVLRERYAEYLAYERLRTGMEVGRVARLVGTGMSIACAALVLLGLDWSVRVDAEGLAVNGYLGLGEERHAFADVRAIRTAPALVAPNGNVVARREYLVTFADGRSWSTNNLLSDTPPAEKERLAALLSGRAGVEIQEVELFRMDEL